MGNESSTVSAPKIPEPDDEDLYILACGDGDLPQVKQIVRKNPSFVKGTRDDHNWAGIHIACRMGYFDIIMYLVDHDPTVLFQRNAQGQTGLDIAREQQKKYGYPVDKKIIEWLEKEQQQHSSSSSSSSFSSSTLSVNRPRRVFINIFHDSENCYLPKNWQGNVSRLYDEVIRSIANAVFPGNNLNNAENMVVDWQWVMSFSDNQYKISEGNKKVLHDRRVYFQESKDKKGSVDTKVASLIETFHSNFVDFKEERQKQTIAVLLSGDSDFSLEVQKLRQAGCIVVLIHNGQAPRGFMGNFNQNVILEWFPLCERIEEY